MKDKDDIRWHDAIKNILQIKNTIHVKPTDVEKFPIEDVPIKESCNVQNIHVGNLSKQLIAEEAQKTTADRMANLECDDKHADIKEKRNNRVLRKKVALSAQKLAIWSIQIWIAVLFIQAYGAAFDKVIFNDTQFIAITSGCTVNILAAFITVIQGLFGKSFFGKDKD